MTTYKNSLIDIKDAIYDDICEADTIDREVVEVIAAKYNVVIDDDDYETIKEEWEEY